jgi:hypothetical protein
MYVFLRWFHYVAQAGLELKILWSAGISFFHFTQLMVIYFNDNGILA